MVNSDDETLPSYDWKAASKLAIGMGLCAGVIAYAVNGGDVVRALLGGLLATTFGWFGGKVLF